MFLVASDTMGQQVDRMKQAYSLRPDYSWNLDTWVISHEALREKNMLDSTLVKPEAL